MASCNSFINITITDMTGRICNVVLLPKNFTLTDFKKALEENFGFDNGSGYCYFCEGDQLTIDDETAFNSQKHSIINGVCILRLPRLCGGGGLGVDFVDLSNTNGFKRYRWSHRAPAWRITGQGLSLEGNCKNKSCEAFQQQVIICIGFGKFDLLKDTNDNSKCPRCHEYVEPITCAFNNCRWRYHGLKQTQPGVRAEKLSTDWKIADNAYHLFDQNISGTVVWRELIIETERT